jgi:hypothetical protein
MLKMTAKLSKMSEELIRKITEPAMQRRIMESSAGSAGFALIVAIAKSATSVNDWLEISNDALCEILDYKAPSALYKNREKCSDWLSYQKGAGAKVGQYRLKLDSFQK